MKNWPFQGLELHGYSVILADPPWRFKTYNEAGRKKCPDWRPFEGSPSLHYDTMSTKDIAALPVKYLARRDCVLLMWATMPMLPEALSIIEAWGFRYKTMGFTWMKTCRKSSGLHLGTGYWTRSNAELCILATRGRPQRLHADVRQAILSPVREHSRKPDEQYERIERLLAGKYLELFARTTREGWSSWGNQTDKFT